MPTPTSASSTIERPSTDVARVVVQQVPVGPRHLVSPRTWRVVVAGLVLFAATAAVLGVWSGSDTADIRSDAPTREELATRIPSGPEDYFNVNGSTPTSFPETTLGLAFLTLDDPLARALDVLGPPTFTEPDIFGTAHSWSLPGGARLTVGAGDDTHTIDGLYAFVPIESSTRLGVFGQVVIGQSSLRELVSGWGGAFSAATSPFDDYVVRYDGCVGRSPIVVKFDQVAANDIDFAPVPISGLWDAPVTSVLIAYADEPPGSGGCST
jgi:hypothetical protein